MDDLNERLETLDCQLHRLARHRTDEAMGCQLGRLFALQSEIDAVKRELMRQKQPALKKVRVA